MNNKNSYLISDYHNLVYALANKLCKLNSKPVIICLGTDKVIADSLGPIVGHLLTTKYNIKTYVYGSLKRTVNSTNLEYYFSHINKTHKNQNLLVIDAGLGSLEQVGKINVTDGGIIPYNNSYYKKIGDISVTGIVLEKGLLEKMQLRQTKLNFVSEMAEMIAKVIYHAYQMTY
ncbi:MAG: spore protease YyaC [Clostridia bacterium]|nr:spore protease YyaC [Clostridia bacterium]